MRSGHDPRNPDKSGDEKKPCAARPVERGKNGGEAEHVGRVARGKGFAGLRRKGNFGRFDPRRFGERENLRFDRREADHACCGERLRGTGASKGALEGIDKETLDQCDGKKKRNNHGPRSEAALPHNEQADQNHGRKPKVQAREHGHGFIEPGPTAVGIEVKKETLVERGRHVC